jgi:hypothetical protein
MASVRKRVQGAKTTWLTDYVDQEGKRHNKTFTTRRAAEAFRADVMSTAAHIRRNGPFQLVLEQPTYDNTALPLSIEQIRTLPSPVVCGIYFLFLNGEMQRIGQSVDVAQRVQTHRQQKRVPFDECHVLQCRPEDLDMLEALYIRKFDPPHNGELKRRRRAAE